MDKPEFVMPAHLREAGLTGDQCRVAYGYWMLRVKFARHQPVTSYRPALVLINMLLVTTIQEPAFAAAAGSSFTTLTDTLMALIVPTGLVLCILASPVRRALLFTSTEK